MKPKRQFTKALALILSLLMLFTMIPISVSADTSGEAIAITDAAGFAAMTADGNYYLANNITITSTYVGTFKGRLDGKNCTVTTIVPLFKTVDGGTIENLTVAGTINDIAAVACYISGNTTFNNIINEASVNGSSRTIKQDYQDNASVTIGDSATGGIAGAVVGSVADGTTVTFENCVNKGEVKIVDTKNVSYTGGILGGAIFHSLMANDGLINKANVKFINCANEGKIQSGAHAGGILGFATGLASIYIDKCQNSSDVIASTGDAGGMFGKVQVTTAMTVTDCHNSGNISATNNPAAGIIGVPFITGTTNYVINCTNMGTITASGSSGKRDASGIVGYSDKGAINIINCHNSGIINGANAAAGILAEALVGAKIVNCSNTASVTCTANYAAGIVAYGKDVEVDISYSYNVGTIKSNGIVGGISGRINSVLSDVTGCYNGGAVGLNEGVATGKCAQIFVGTNYGDLLNNYYDKAQSDNGVRGFYIKGTEEDNNSEYCTAYETADITSGKLAYDMNKAIGEQVYYQNLTDTDAAKYPTLDGADGSVVKAGDNYCTLRLETADKAAVRIDGEKNGLRVTTAVNKADYDKLIAAGVNANDLTFGTVFAPASYVEAVVEAGGVFTMNSLKAILSNVETSYVDVHVAKKGGEGFWATDADAYHFRGSLVNVAKDNLSDGFSAIGYVKLGEDIVYSSYYTTVSIAEVSEMAYEDRAEASDTTYTQTIAANSECAIGAVVTYSPYTEAQLKTLKSYFN